MSIERSRRALALVEELMDVPEEQWEAELLRRAPNEPELHQQVLEILAHAPAEDAPTPDGLHRVLRALGSADGGETESDPLEISAIIDQLPERFSVSSIAGRGGSSIVVKAWDAEQNVHVAIKFLKDPTTRGLPPRGRREQRIAEALDHPGIVPVIGSGRAGTYAFLVMPFIEGGTLRDRMTEGSAMPIEEAVRITLEASRALAFAHERGIVHRDLKPENFLMDGDRPLLTDFGIARETEADPNTFRTSEGHIVGTVSYMSPERAAGEGEDARSDLYSIGCILYELLTGEPPFLGSTSQSVMKKHVTDTAGSPRRLRPTIPQELDAVLGRLLAKSPADRFQSARELVAALQGIDDAPESPWRTAGGRLPATPQGRVAVVGSAAVLATVAAVVWGGLAGPAPLDPDRIAVFPSALGAERAYTASDRQLVDALASWAETSLVAEPALFDALRSEGEGPLPLARAAAIAVDLGAGRFVLGHSGPENGTTYSASIYTSQGPLRAEHQGAVDVAATTAALDMLVLSDHLLSGSTPDSDAVGSAGTSSIAARRAYTAGLEHIRGWELDAAVERLREALEIDHDFPSAHLALARTRHWRGDPTSLWEASAAQAALAAEDLSLPRRLEARGLAFLSTSRLVEACAAFAELTEFDPDSFAGWFGRGDCLWRDLFVLPDAGSPSGHRFRSNQTAAVRYFHTAFRRNITSLSAFRTDSFRRLRDRLFARRASIRIGRGEANGPSAFVATSIWAGDSLAIVPYAWPPSANTPSSPSLEDVEDARIRQRALVRALMDQWVDEAPEDPEALYGVSVALEMQADPAALDSILRARALEQEEPASRELAATQAWIMIKHGIGRADSLVAAGVSLADSLLDTSTPGEAAHPVLMASLAAVTGRAELAAAYGAQAAYEQSAFPEQLERAAVEYTIAAATGAPDADLGQTEDQLWEVIQATRIGDQVFEATLMFMERGAVLAFPPYVSRLHGQDHPFQSPLGRAQAAWIRGDRAAAARELHALGESRRGTPASSIAIDVLYPEARLRMEMGDTTAAVSLLAPALADARWIEPGLLRAEPVRAAVFSRAVRELGALDPASLGRWTVHGRHLTAPVR